MEKVVRGEIDDEPVPGKVDETKEKVPEKEVDRGLEPPVPEFILDLTNISSVDMCVLYYLLIVLLSLMVVYG